MKLRLLAAATLAALVLTAGAASAQDTTSEKGKVSYALGYRAGLDIARVIGSGEQLDMATVMKAFQDATRPVFDKWTATVGKELVKKAETAIANAK